MIDFLQRFEWEIRLCAMVFLFGCLGTYLSLSVFRSLAPRLGLLDVPDSRRIHTQATPRGAGIALWIGYTMACFVFLIMAEIKEGFQMRNLWWPSLLFSTAVMTFIGLLDDRYHLRPSLKLAGQISAAAIFVLFGSRSEVFFGIPLDPLSSTLFSILWIVLITNTFNLIDGIDGLATGLGLISTLGLFGTFVHRGLGFESLLAFALLGPCCVFLHYNWHPAKVFLGDAGSNFLGFTLAVLTLATSSKGSIFAYLWVPLLAFSVPLLDTVLAILRRGNRALLRFFGYKVAKGSSQVFSADLEHLHHKLLAAGVSVRDASGMLLLSASSLVFVALLGLQFEQWASALILPLLLFGIFFLNKRLPLIEAAEAFRTMLFAVDRPHQQPRVLLSLFLDLLSWLFWLPAIFLIASWLEASSLFPTFREISPFAQLAILSLPLCSLFFLRRARHPEDSPVRRRSFALCQTLACMLLGSAAALVFATARHLPHWLQITLFLLAASLAVFGIKRLENVLAEKTEERK